MGLYFAIFLTISWFLALWTWRNRKRLTYYNWPLIGMMPVLLLNVGRIHEICTEILLDSRRETFTFKGPWLANMEILGPSNIANVHYIMSANFKNFPKGPQFKEMFDVLGEGIFNADWDSWKQQRKAARTLINYRRFQMCVAEISWEKDLVPVLEMASRENLVIDLQDVFQRFTFDTICALVTGYDPGCLSLDLQAEVPFSKSMDDAEDAIFLRYVLPERLWKLQRWLGVGSERKLKRARRILDNVFNEYIARKRNELESKGKFSSDHEEKESLDLLTSYILGSNDTPDQDHKCDDNFLRDTILNLMIAGRDTTSSALTWFIWLVSIHPKVKNLIRQELRSICQSVDSNKWGIFNEHETSKFVYTHGALCEALRLCPPMPFQQKEPVELDVLPTGHYLHPKMNAMLFLYAMGRMESNWDKDCKEFRPERWILECGTIKHEPSYKFLAFNAGPRTSLGNEVAFTEMKMVVVACYFDP